MKYIVIDLFAGAGGVTTGIENATINGEKIATVIAAVNHDAKAIASHMLNHAEAVHFTEDIRLLDLSKLVLVANKAKVKYPDAKLVIWASAECTNYSKAKGGQPRDADSRTLPESLFRYIEALSPDIIQVENVVEFMAWGPLDEKGKPLSRKAGRDYIIWKQHIESLGYEYNYRILNSADFGAYTSRERYFGVFVKPGNSIVWPEPTHSKKAVGSLFGTLKRWNPVKHVLDLNDTGESIFDRKKQLSDKTLERIYAGLIKYVAGGDTQFLSKYFSGNPDSKNISISGPAASITTKDHHAVVQCFISQYYGNGGNKSIENPATTLTTKDRLSLIWIDKQYSGSLNHQSANRPLGAITTNPKSSIINAFLVNPSWGGNNGSIEKPCCVIVARQDKAPLYLINVESGFYKIPVYKEDSEAMVKIKEFMALYGIVDIKMRMLKIKELLQIMGFPIDYKLIGTQTDQKKFIGNAVVTILPQKWYEAMALHELREVKINAA